MATITPVEKRSPGRGVTFTWSNIGNGDTPASADISGRERLTAQILGGHGLNNTVTLQGSNNDVDYAGINDLQDNAISQADTGTAAITDLTPVADVLSSLNDTYAYFSSAGTDFYIWFNIDTGGTDPAIAGRTGIEIAVAEDASVAVITAEMTTVMDALASFGVVDGTTKVTVTNAAKGAPRTGFSDPGSSGITANVTTAGADGTRPLYALQEKPKYCKPASSAATVDTNLTVVIVGE